MATKTWKWMSGSTVAVLAMATMASAAGDRPGSTPTPIPSPPIVIDSNRVPQLKICARQCGYKQVMAESEWSSLDDKTVLAECPKGLKVVGGGAAVILPGDFVLPQRVALTESAPTQVGPGGPDAWLAGAAEINPTDRPWLLRVTLLCAPVEY